MLETPDGNLSKHICGRYCCPKVRSLDKWTCFLIKKIKIFGPGAKQLQIDLALLISARTEECQFTSAEYIKKEKPF